MRLNIKLIHLSAIFLGSLLFCGCLVGPDYTPPEVKVPDEWRLPESALLVPGETDIRTWWDVFQDPMLTELINEAGTSNLDLKVAVARVKEARARLGVARGELLPSVDTSGSATRNRTSENSATPGGVTYDSYTGSLDASWEIDLFGKIRRSVEAAEADYQATEEDRIGVMVTLYAEMASNYLQVRTTQTRLAASIKNIKSQKEVLDLTKTLFKNGLATGLDVSQAERVLASSEAELPPLYNSLNQSINAVALLLAKPPGAVEDRLSKAKPIPTIPAQVAVGVPVDIMRQRPDVRSAERQLAAATARIGQATADLYPSFSIAGSLGLASMETSSFFSGGSRFYSFGPSFNWNLFAGGRIRAQIKVQDALTEQALLTYEQTVLNALNEVDNAATAFFQQRRRVFALMRTVKAARRTVELSVKLYKEGLTDFQSVLDAQRSLFGVDNDLAQARGELVNNLVQLYKALGGGWKPSQASESPEKAKEEPKPITTAGNPAGRQ
jgi:multidrug efflux system outer membrane protein